MPVDVSHVRDELSFDERSLGLSDSEFNELIGRLIKREVERVEDVVNVSLESKTVTETLERPSGVQTFDLPLPKRPVTDVSSVDVDTDRVGGPGVGVEDVIVHETHLELKPDTDRSRWPTERRSVTVEWTHGYGESVDVPGPIQAAIIGLVRSGLQEIEADGIESESISNQSVTYELRDDVIRRHLQRAQRFDEPTYYGGAMVV